MRDMSLAPSAQLKVSFMSRKRWTPPRRGFMSMRATDLSSAICLRETARFTAAVVAPTPPLLPITLTRAPFFSFTFSGPLTSVLLINFARDAITSSLLRGWMKNSLTPIFNAFKRTSGSLREDVRKISLARLLALTCSTKLNSSLRSEPISTTMMSQAAPLLLIEQPGTAETASSTPSAVARFFIFSLTVMLFPGILYILHFIVQGLVLCLQSRNHLALLRRRCKHRRSELRPRSPVDPGGW